MVKYMLNAFKGLRMPLAPYQLRTVGRLHFIEEDYPVRYQKLHQGLRAL